MPDIVAVQVTITSSRGHIALFFWPLARRRCATGSVDGSKVQRTSQQPPNNARHDEAKTLADRPKAYLRPDEACFC